MGLTQNQDTYSYPFVIGLIAAVTGGLFFYYILAFLHSWDVYKLYLWDIYSALFSYMIFCFVIVWVYYWKNHPQMRCKLKSFLKIYITVELLQNFDSIVC